jgi:ubiquitin-conjugating enzyme E2 A
LPNPEKFYHPNIYIDGEICEKTLSHYDPTMTIRKRIDAFVTLLGVPNPNSPACSDAAKLYNQNPRDYNRKALRVFRGLEKK